MKVEIISTSEVPAAIGPYSIATKYGNLIYTSGQLGINPKTGIMDESIETQTRQALTNIKTILESAGSGMDRIVKTTVFLSDMSNFSKMNEVYSTFFKGSYPSRSAIEVAKLPKDALVEIEAVAITKI